mmetsp:Transcript_1752/g.4428  ORF Transcript_1752/g.4428 Transcript_1752/m.4428 type:complete len:398 (+) Transcript_1752:70-1263(+)
MVETLRGEADTLTLLEGDEGAGHRTSAASVHSLVALFGRRGAVLLGVVVLFSARAFGIRLHLTWRLMHFAPKESGILSVSEANSLEKALAFDDRAQKVHAAMCGVNVGLASILLGKSGLAINAAVQACPDHRGPCSASVSGLLAGFLYSARFLSAAAAECQSSLQLFDADKISQASCAVDVNLFLGSLALLASTGSTMHDTCGGGPESGEDELADDGARRLQIGEHWDVDRSKDVHVLVKMGRLNRTAAAEKLNTAVQKLQFQWPALSAIEAHAEAEAIERADEAECAFDASFATILVARAGLLINAGIVECSVGRLRGGGNEAKATCAANIGSIIGAFSFMAASMSYAVSHCDGLLGNHTPPLCAAAILDTIGAVAEVAASGSGFNRHCLPDAPLE